ncbi:hypothetical protein CIB48_g4125 [Xylaria polymorpha]|nr:hypothetical protein CIB48_g4125 [Xylaria polymorpha]
MISQKPIGALSSMKFIREFTFPMYILSVLLVPPQQRHEVLEVEVFPAVIATAKVPATQECVDTDQVLFPVVGLDPDGDEKRPADVASAEVGNPEARRPLWRYYTVPAAVVARAWD